MPTRTDVANGPLETCWQALKMSVHWVDRKSPHATVMSQFDPERTSV